MNQSCFGRALASSLLLIAFGFQIQAEQERSGLGESPPHTILQKCSWLCGAQSFSKASLGALGLPNHFDSPKLFFFFFFWKLILG